MQHSMLSIAAAVVAVCLAVVSVPAASQQTAAPASIAGGAAQQTLTREAPFLAENNAAMDTMMAGMAVKPTGDVDADFAAMMIPHHQGAIDMALAELRYGQNEQLRRIAQEIIVDQQQEIAAMRLALGQPLPPRRAAPTQVRCHAGRDAQRIGTPDAANEDETGMIPMKRSLASLRRSSQAYACRRHAGFRRAGARRRLPRRTSRSAIATASMPPSSSPTPCRSSIPPTTSCSA